MKIKGIIITKNSKIYNWQVNILSEAQEFIDFLYIINISYKEYSKKKIFFSKLKSIFLKESSILNIQNFDNNIINLDYKNHKIITPLLKKKFEEFNKEGINFALDLTEENFMIDNISKKINIFSFRTSNDNFIGFKEIANKKKKSNIVTYLNGTPVSNLGTQSASYKIEHYSIGKTLRNYIKAYSYLCLKIIKNSNRVQLACSGKINEKDNNITIYEIFNFFKINNLSKLKKIIYGAFYEKKWNIAYGKNNLCLTKDSIINIEKLNIFKISKKYNFYADPFFSYDNKKIRYEALNKNGVGDILEYSLEKKSEKLLLTGAHYSYPSAIIYKDKEYLLPEVGNHSDQYMFDVNHKNPQNIFLKGFQNKRIVDATIYYHNNFYYLFFCFSNEGGNILHLWLSDSLLNEFQPHICSPICIDPSRSRMAGNITFNDGSLYRFGQNNQSEYGESLSIMKIEDLSPSRYCESNIGSITLMNQKGPHTLNFDKDNNMVLDFYKDKFSFFAGFRRLGFILSKKYLSNRNL